MENIKIGILTFHNADNYGAVLQAYALQQYIFNNISADVEIIDYRKKNEERGFSLFRGSTHSPVKNLVLNILHLIQRRSLKISHQKFEQFRKEWLKLTKERYESENALAKCDAYDYYITGSDQVFNPRLSDYRAYYLSTISGGGKKLAYAPSFGISSFSDAITQQILPLLKDFVAVSCREVSGAKYLSGILQVEIPVVLDPVFLLTKDDWEHVAVAPSMKKKYLLVYCLSKGKSSKINRLAHSIAKKENLSVVTIGSSGLFTSNGVKGCGPREFVGYFQHADFVLTDSFHGTSFSLIFGKRHLSYIANKDKGTRIEAVMSAFGKASEIIYDIDSYEYQAAKVSSTRNFPTELLDKSKHYLHDHLK